MSPHPHVYALLRHASLVSAIACAGAFPVQAQEAQPPAYLAVVTGEATLERAGESEPATANMPFVVGDRLRTGAGRVEIAFPDGTAIEVGEQSEVEAISATRVRLIAGTMDHIQRAVAPSQSATYLPQDLQTYGSTFDQYGSWQYDQPYGYVWYPQVGPDWRPYSYGSWSPIRSYGWTWVGAEAWAWPTHHYGRWGFARNAWFWIPGRTWGAAWVSWSFADDYVSWCPLGWNSRPVFALSIGSRRGWDYWTVPRRTFETRAYGRNYAGYYRGGSRSIGGREPFNGVRSGRSAPNDRWTSADRRSSFDFRRPSQPGVNRPAATGGAIAVPRVGGRDGGVGRDSGFARRDSGVGVRSGRDQSTPRTYVPPQTSWPAARGGAIAMPRTGARDSFGSRDSGFAGRDSGLRTRNRPSAPEYRQTPDDRRPTSGARPAPDYRRSTADSRPSTTDSRRREAPGASAPRSMPHERAAPAGGHARGQAQGRRR